MHSSGPSDVTSAPDGPEGHVRALADAIGAIRSFDDLADRAAAVLAQSFAPDRIAFYVRVGRENTLRIAARRDETAGTPGLPPPARDVVLATVRDGTVHRVDRGDTRQSGGGRRAFAPFPVLCAPLLHPDGLLGALYLDNVLHRDRPYGPRDQAVAARVAAVVADALRRPALLCDCGIGHLRPLARDEMDRLCVCR